MRNLLCSAGSPCGRVHVMSFKPTLQVRLVSKIARTKPRLPHRRRVTPTPQRQELPCCRGWGQKLIHRTRV
eukprot:4915862-Prymnesium_polylepis.1